MSAAGPVRHGQELTARELQVLRLLAAGRSNAQIGQELHLSEDTIKTHVQRVLIKLGARNRTAAVAQGYEQEILRPARVARTATSRAVSVTNSAGNLGISDENTHRRTAA